MDPICHTLVGAALAQAGLKTRTPLATATLVIGANLPDVDGITYLLGESLWWRRGWTHGVLALLVWPAVLTALMVAWDRAVRGSRPVRRHPPPNPTELFWLSALAVLTHPTLDYMNNYGLRWLMPFADRWFYGDALFIVDPWIWTVLGAGALASWWLGRRWPRRRSWTRPARVALAVTTTYTALMLLLGQAGRGVVQAQFAARGVAIVGDPMVSPVFADPLTRYAVATDGSSYYIAAFRWAPHAGLAPGTRVIRRNDDHPAVAVARASPAARAFLNWGRFPFFTVREVPAGYVVTMDDARYAPSGGPSWAAVQVHVPQQAASGGTHLEVPGPARKPANGHAGGEGRAVALLSTWCRH